MKNYNLNINGFGLIESMIAIVVFSFGLLGVAGVIMVSLKNNHSGYMRTQAVFLTSSIADMMRANAIAVKSNLYNGNNYTGLFDVSNMCTSINCNPTDLRDRDVQLWSNMITQILPNSIGSIQCEAHVGELKEPYSGICKVQITWSESNENNAKSLQLISTIVKPTI